MMEGGLLCLKWRDHHATFFRMMSAARKKEAYSDVTIACEGRFYPVHRLVLSTCSDYFDKMFSVTEGRALLMLVLTGVGHRELEMLLDYIYLGEVNVLQSDLATFMKAADALMIKGLAEPSEAAPPHNHDKKRKLSLQDPEPKRRVTSEEPPSDAESLPVAEEDPSHDTPKTQPANESSHSSRPEILSPAQLASVELDEPVKTRPEPAPTLPNTKEEKHMDEVHFEDVHIKDEPTDWGQAGDNPLVYDPGLAYLAKVPPPAALQPELHAQAVPGPSGIQACGVWEHQTLGVMPDEYGHYHNKGANIRKMGRPTSEIWKYYKADKIDGKTVAYCKFCLLKYGFPNATKMRAHTVKCKKSPEEVKRLFREVKQEGECVEAVVSPDIHRWIQLEPKVTLHYSAPAENCGEST